MRDFIIFEVVWSSCLGRRKFDLSDSGDVGLLGRRHKNRFWLSSQKIVVMEEGKIDELVYNDVVDILRFWT